jgi:nucleotide-binding universal stress UspA family protein
LGAHLVGIHVLPAETALHPYDCYAAGRRAIDQVISGARQFHADADAAAAVLGKHFHDLLGRADVAGEFRLIARGEASREAVLSSLHSDLVVMGHPEPHGLPDGLSHEGMLMASGAPLLIVPNAWQRKTIGDNVLIAWNASREARRAVSDAMSFLAAAKTVSILVIDAAERRSHGEEPGADLALQLARHGAHVGVVRLASHGKPVAGLILAEAASSSADLLVFGAYSHTRAREILLGGATRTLLAEMPVPVLVSR